ncbi:hypothetical protein Clacol_004348 [Clathrus columnatus]|uniref:Uncharacterized protein n=1 Tax=Clathrus columnatus TaxID=1419009 RepID=A0AAV5A993_9AGAM|nr:hypothetical protein Clacol_004348 [Clathrus columnatus]
MSKDISTRSKILDLGLPKTIKYGDAITIKGFEGQYHINHYFTVSHCAPPYQIIQIIATASLGIAFEHIGFDVPYEHDPSLVYDTGLEKDCHYAQNKSCRYAQNKSCVANPVSHKPSSSWKRTIDLVAEDELEPEVAIVPPKKAKFVPPLPKNPCSVWAKSSRTGASVALTRTRTACSLVPEMRAMLRRKERATVSKKTKKAVAGSSVNNSNLNPVVSLLEDKLDALIKVTCCQQDTQDRLLAKVDLMLTDLRVVADYCHIHNQITPLGLILDANLAWKLFSAELAFKADLVDLVDVEDQEMPESEEENTGKGKGKEKEVVEEENEEEKGDHLPSDLSELDRNL